MIVAVMIHPSQSVSSQRMISVSGGGCRSLGGNAFWQSQKQAEYAFALGITF